MAQKMQTILSKTRFKNSREYLNYTDKIADAFYDEDLEELSKLLSHKVSGLQEAENYFNDIWKRQVKIGGKSIATQSEESKDFQRALMDW